MNIAANQNVLRRKVAAGREGQFLREMSLSKALRLTVPKVADELYGLPLGVIGVSATRILQSDVSAQFSEDDLLILLDGPGGATAAAAVNKDLVEALIQQQTMGQVLASNESSRPLTQTDAAMVAPLLDAVLARSCTLPETDAEQNVLKDFTFGAKAEDSRALDLALDAAEFHIFKLSVDIARGVRQAKVQFFMPIPRRPPVPEIIPEERHKNAARMENIINSLPAELTAVLCKLRLPLSDVSRFCVGDVIPVSREELKKTGLYAQSGRKICNGQLGKNGGHRAVLLCIDAPQTKQDPPNEAKAPVQFPTGNTAAAKSKDKAAQMETTVRSTPGDSTNTDPIDPLKSPETKELAIPDQAETPLISTQADGVAGKRP